MRRLTAATILAIIFSALLAAPTRAGSCSCDYTDLFTTEKKCEKGAQYQSVIDCPSNVGGGNYNGSYHNCAFFPNDNCQAVAADDYGTTKIVDDLLVSPPPKLQVNIPGLTFTEIAKNSSYIDDDGNVIIPIPWLGEYIAGIYTFAMIIASVLAVVVIIVSGVRIIVSGGGEQKSAGYKGIAGAVVGLLIAWGSYAILYTISPDLTAFKALKVRYVAPVDMPPDLGESMDESGPTGVAPQAGMVELLMPNLSGGKGNYARADVAAALKKAVAEYGGAVSLGSALRTPREQYRLMTKLCGCTTKESALPPDVSFGQWSDFGCKCKGCVASCAIGRKNGEWVGPTSGHIVGNAVDVSAAGGSKIECLSASEPEVKNTVGVLYSATMGARYCVPIEQQKLIKTMLNNGFCVGLKSSSRNLRESWHFELTTNGVRLSPFCVNDKNDANLKKLHYLFYDKSLAEMQAAAAADK